MKAKYFLLGLIALLFSCSNDDLDDYILNQQYEGWFEYVKEYDDCKVFKSIDYNSILIIYDDFHICYDINIGDGLKIRIQDRTKDMKDGMIIIISDQINSKSRLKTSIIGVRHTSRTER